ncbi:hypothetical protein CUN85_12430 [Methanolobus halotolerans]|uniref:Uncharacterized protein n=1 Tax=Methanolobus halotolerans TaxID=2052935 RepID=A0A4E0Q2D6_9EURY|nr:hypothetical protein CUN85_12430 [Methanolobus halotolerans]
MPDLSMTEPNNKKYVIAINLIYDLILIYRFHGLTGQDNRLKKTNLSSGRAAQACRFPNFAQPFRPVKF